MSIHVEQADVLHFLKRQPDKSVDLIFGSPPYEDCRLYLEDGKDLGIARKRDDWVAWMVEVFTESHRVCKGLVAYVVEGKTENYCYSGSPVLLWAELIKRGFNTRKACLYARYGIPGSGGPDWFSNGYEFILCVTPPGRLPWSENTACGWVPKYKPGGAMSSRGKDGARVRRSGSRTMLEKVNPGNIVWCGAVGGGNMGEGSEFAHENEAPFPEKLPERFVLSFCPPGGIVCDPFLGSGTTLAVAVRHGRSFVGCDLRNSQVQLALRRVAQETPLGLLL